MAKKIDRRILGYKDFKKTKDGLEKPKKHPIKEGHLIESIGTSNEALSASTLERMEGLAHQRNLMQFNELLSSLTKDWLDEGFDREDVMDYINDQIAIIANVFSQEKRSGKVSEAEAQSEVGETASYSIELDCPPGFPRPGDLFPDVIKGTGLEESDFENTSRSFGNWTWVLTNKAKTKTYEEARPEIKKRVTSLYNAGKIRYGSW